jgi:hypothetical protein
VADLDVVRPHLEVALRSRAGRRRRAPSRTAATAPTGPAHDLSLRHDALLPEQCVLGHEICAAAHDVGASPPRTEERPITWRRTATVSVFTVNFVKGLKIVGAEVERERRAKASPPRVEYGAAQRLAPAAHPVRP